MLGKSEKFKAFLKGALGWQFAKLMTTGPAVSSEVTDSGFFGGLGVGGMIFFNEKVFLNLEYEWAYQSNSLL
jgi:hypothetical protein